MTGHSDEPPIQMTVQWATPRPMVDSALSEYLAEMLPKAAALFEGERLGDELVGDVDNWKPQGIVSSLATMSPDATIEVEQ